MGVQLHDLELGFSDLIRITMEKTNKIDKIEFIKIKNLFFHGHKESEKQPTEWEKIFANHIYAKSHVEYIKNS